MLSIPGYRLSEEDLRLAIARQIIVEKHGGLLQCNSSPPQNMELAILILVP